LFDQQWGSVHECHTHNFDQEACWEYVLKQQLVTPASIAADERLAQVYSDMPSAQALRAE